MDFNTIRSLTYVGVALVVAIISATIMRAKESGSFDIIDAFISMLFGVLWPFTIVATVVYLTSGFLYDKFFKSKKEN